VGLGGFVYLALALWRGFRVNLRADASGITVTNLLRRRRIDWPQIAAIQSPHETSLEPLTLQIDVLGSGLRRLWSGTSVYATLGIGKERRRGIALELAALGRNYGQGIPAGTEDEIAEQFKAGLFDNRDPEAHIEWWAVRS
jgi:Bacterial PH domain